MKFTPVRMHKASAPRMSHLRPQVRDYVGTSMEHRPSAGPLHKLISPLVLLSFSYDKYKVLPLIAMKHPSDFLCFISISILLSCLLLGLGDSYILIKKDCRSSKKWSLNLLHVTAKWNCIIDRRSGWNSPQCRRPTQAYVPLKSHVNPTLRPCVGSLHGSDLQPLCGLWQPRVNFEMEEQRIYIKIFFLLQK